MRESHFCLFVEDLREFDCPTGAYAEAPIYIEEDDIYVRRLDELVYDDKSVLVADGIYVDASWLITDDEEKYKPGKHIKTITTVRFGYSCALVLYEDRNQVAINRGEEVLFSEYFPRGVYGMIESRLLSLKSEDDLKMFIKELEAMFEAMQPELE